MCARSEMRGLAAISLRNSTERDEVYISESLCAKTIAILRSAGRKGSGNEDVFHGSLQILRPILIGGDRRGSAKDLSF